MGDFSFRAVETLRSVAAVLAEDTRHSVHLLKRYDVSTPLVAYHEHNEAKATPALVARLLGGESLALISDAGTPLLSDPGGRLVRAAIEAGITISPVPGASALLAALVASGLDPDRFTFFGFLPRKGTERRDTIAEVTVLRHTAVLDEAPSRVADTLAELAHAGAGAREAVVARELTKQFEETRRGTVAELAAYYVDAPPRGEVVIVIAGAAVPEHASEDALRARAAELRAAGRSARDVATALSAELGAPRNLAYRIAHE
jgi:16S rRNA (cytidine1402-2'-O)-methyltransferase